jgi:16S rRNA (guanine527-N7)-methyltransferase
MSYDFKGRLREGLDHLELSLADDSIKSLEIYFNELKKWAGKINLIARSSSDEEILVNHFIDSLTILPLLKKTDSHLLDIGTGAGFPGLVCKTVLPDLKVTLVEPRQKRVSFLRHIIRTLGLQDVAVLDCRIEDEARLPSASSFTHITSRAVSDIKVFMAMVGRFSTGGARVICMKGPKWQVEVADTAQVLSETYIQEEVIELCLPFSGARRALLVYAPCRMQQD